MFVSKHHEGYAHWPSTYSFGYNSKNVGPKLDVVGELSREFRQNYPSIRYGLYYSLFEFYNPLYLKDAKTSHTTRCETIRFEYYLCTKMGKVFNNHLHLNYIAGNM